MNDRIKKQIAMVRELGRMPNVVDDSVRIRHCDQIAETMEKLYSALRYIANEPLEDDWFTNELKYRNAVSGDELEDYAVSVLAAIDS